MLSKSQQLLLIVGLCLSVAKADVDCSKKPKFMKPNTCCPLPDFVTPAIKEKCKEYNVTLPTPTPMSGEQSTEGRRHHHHHPPPCLISCIFNETGFYEDNNLDEAKLKDYLKVVFKDSAELQTVANDAFISCASKMDEFKDKMGNRPRPSPPPGSPVCPKRPSFLMGCVYWKVLKNCPASIWNDSQECNDTKEFFETCKPQHRRPSSGEN